MTTSAQFSMSDWLSGGGEPSLKRFVLNESYARISWVYACVNVISETLGGTPIQFLRGESAGDELQLEIVVNPEDPVNVLFNPPNKPEIPSLRDLIFRTFVHLGIEGGLFWVFGDKSSDGQFTTIATKQLGLLKPIRNDQGELLGWVEIDPRTQQPKQAFNRDEVLPFFYYNPRDPNGPLSPLSAARLSLEGEFYMNGWNAAFFKQGLRAPLTITTKAKLTPTQEKQWAKKIKQFYSGIDDAHTALLMTGGAEAKELALSTKDLDFVDGKKLNREEICATYGVPPAMVGIFEFANYANSQEQRKIFWENTIIPRIHMVEELVQVNVLDPYFPGTIIKFDTSDVEALQHDPKEIADAAKLYFDMGYNRLEVANILGTPELAETITPDDNSDQPETPNDDDDPAPEETPPPADDDEGRVVVIPERVEAGADEWTLKEANPAQWQRYGEAHFAMMRNEETKLNKVVFNWFQSVANAYEKQIRRTAGREAYQDPGLWDDLYRGTVNIQVERLYDMGGQIAAVELQNGAGGPPLPEFRRAKAVALADYLTGDELLAFRDSATEFIGKIQLLGANEVSAINAEIPQLIEEGGSVADIQARIRNLIIEERYKGQATTIARTTANAAYNNARATFFSLKGVTRHKWVNAGDAAVRDSHVQEGGNEVATGQSFPVTHLLYPHDPSGSAAEVINCRCTTIATARGNPSQPSSVRVQPDRASATAMAQQSILTALTSAWKNVSKSSRAVKQPKINGAGKATTHSSRNVGFERREALAQEILLDDSYTQIGKAMESGFDVVDPKKVLKVTQVPVIDDVINTASLTDTGRQNLSDLLQGFLPQRIRDQAPPVNIRRLKPEDKGRAMYDPRTQTIGLDDQTLQDLYSFANDPEGYAIEPTGLSRIGRITTALRKVSHEYGHHLDFTVLEVREFSRQFFRKRTTAATTPETVVFDRWFGGQKTPEFVLEDRVWNTYQLRVYDEMLPPGTSVADMAALGEGTEVVPMFNQVVGLLPMQERYARIFRDQTERILMTYGDEVATPLILDAEGFKEYLTFLYGDF